jgi:hypothetical protein
VITFTKKGRLHLVEKGKRIWFYLVLLLRNKPPVRRGLSLLRNKKTVKYFRFLLA